MTPLRSVAIVLAGVAAAGFLLGPLGAPDARADCRCLYSGHYYRAGEVACIRTPNGPRLARCDKVSNLSSWRFTAKSCSGPSAGQRPALPTLFADLVPATR